MSCHAHPDAVLTVVVAAVFGAPDRREGRPASAVSAIRAPWRPGSSWGVESQVFRSSTVRAVKVERASCLSSVSLATLRRLTQARHVHFPCYAHAGEIVPASASIS
ncbi:hypothetical protein NDU88_007230 [Pleurodeles waltl]|uniref:Secreted protein n=1 Tax=Pleurodeles waltl TaxID=8319 RepID=A0AAV7QRA0_PLEWA|nr:hypothetical protein NDU88_007230 [Pleurodeles waltl]